MFSPKYEALQIEYNVFQRLFDHWQDIQNKTLPIVLEQIMDEILKEQEQTIIEIWKNA